MNTLVKIDGTRDNMIEITTYNKRDKKHKFCFYANFMKEFIARPRYTFGERDIMNLALVYPAPDNVYKFEFFFTDGKNQILRIDGSTIEECILGKTKKTVLVKEFASKQPHVNTTRANKVIRNALGNKLKKRALSKAMRDNFKWPGTKEIILTSDGNNDFYFKEVLEGTLANCGICGGLIFSNYNGKYMYTMHT